MTGSISRRWLAAIGTASVLAASAAHAENDGRAPARQYEVQVTNITRDQQFTPILTVVHGASVSLFRLGSPAGSELATLAEEGNTAPLTTRLQASDQVASVATQDGLLDPGQTRIFRVEAKGTFASLSLAAMLIPTNDAFFALTIANLPQGWQPMSLRGVAYDAGSERNDERCNSIPGPMFSECGGPGGGARVGGGEGFVHVHAGIHGIGDLQASRRDWRNPVISVVVRRIR